MYAPASYVDEERGSWPLQVLDVAPALTALEELHMCENELSHIRLALVVLIHL